MYINGLLDKEIYKFLNDNKLLLKCGYFYFLLKIYKIFEYIYNVLMNGYCSIRKLLFGRLIIV